LRHYRLTLVMLAALTACAGQPHPPSPAAGLVAASTAAPAATAASAAAGAAAASGAVPAATATPTAAGAVAATDKGATKLKPPAGWTTRVRDGATVYCRTDTAVGSRIPIQYCLTQADMQELLWRQKKGREDLERQRLQTPTVCPNPAVCN
jgi:hypothetical protein